MSEDSDPSVDPTIMKDLSFKVEPTTPEPTIWVDGVMGQVFKNLVPHERFDYIVNLIGGNIAEHLSGILEEMAQLGVLIEDLESDEERALANYIIRCAAWTFVNKSGIPVFLFDPREIPEEILVEARESIGESFQERGRRGFVKVKRGGKTSWKRNSDRRNKKL